MQAPVLIALASMLVAARAAPITTSANQCILESGYDYIGKDIGNASSSSPGGCCEICEATDGCKAYSWTAQDGGSGTCWLKSGRGTIVMNLYVHSSTVQPLDAGADDDVGGCQLEEGIDYVGNDLDYVSATSAGDCCDLCSAQPYFQAPSCGIEYVTDYVGNDIGEAAASKPEECCDICTDREGCRAWSWVWIKGRGGICYLKEPH
ncbi:unnamed protein product [Phytophthora lilii]|uniref:Unnamed protein product n=1 Tax=Phytophthora lilii TaxID=2077276 RepID=A0A9W6TUX3_9STRA|nr:unnamed protein product [Phytophthora lilii]